MNKQIPSINKIVQFHNFKRSMQLHQSKIKNAKPTLTTRINNQPKLNINLNKTAKQPFGNSFSRMIDIELQNKALLKKLTQKNNKPLALPVNQQQSWQQTTNMKCITNNRKKYFQQHQRRIQNQGLLRRMKQIKPLYQMRKYMSERKMTQKYINSISKFNYKDYKPNKTILKFDMDVLRQETELVSSRQKQWMVDDSSHNNKENSNSNQKQVKEGSNRSRQIKNRENKIKTELKKSKAKMFTERNPNIHIHQQPITKRQKHHQNYDLIQNNSSLYRTSQLSHQNSPSKMMQSSFVINQIPQKQIKINGKFFILKGRQTMTKVRLQILELKKDKSIGNEYIHEVEISSAIYKKKFNGRIDVIIENLKFNQKNQAFYIC